MKKKIVLLTGKKGSGKTFNALLLQKKYGGEIISFASPIKNDMNEVSKTLFDKDIKTLTPDEKEIIRPLLQQYGQIGRALSQSFWVDKAIKDIRESHSDIIYIDDARFPNEIEAFKSLHEFDVITIRIKRESEIQGVDTDISEIALDHLSDEWFTLTIEESVKEIFEGFEGIIYA